MADLQGSLTLLLEEMKYRHDLYWKLLFRFLYIELFTFAINFLYAGKTPAGSVRVTGSSLAVLIAAALFIVGAIGTVILINEYYRLLCVNRSITQLKQQMSIFYPMARLKLKGLNRYIIGQSSKTYPLANYAPLFMALFLAAVLFINRSADLPLGYSAP